MPRPFGLDISKYQAPQDKSIAHGIDFDVMLSKVDFLFVRAGYAGSASLKGHEDERVREYMADLFPRLKANPKPFTFYWFFRDDASITSQATVFSRLVSEFKEVVNLPLIVDAEVFVKGDSTSTQKIVDFQFEVERMTGMLVDILYARSWQLNEETVPGLELVLPYLQIARYHRGEGAIDGSTEPWEIPPDNPMLKPRDYDDWDFWQYADGESDAQEYGVGPLGDDDIDKNVYNGTHEELLAWAKIAEPVPPPVDPPDPPIDYGMEVRSEGKSTSQVHLYTLYPPPNTVVPHLLSLAFGKGEVDTVNVFAVIGGVPFKFTQVNLEYRSFYFFEFPTLWLRPDDYIMVEFIPAEGQHVISECKIAWT